MEGAGTETDVVYPENPLTVPITKLLWKLRAGSGWRHRDYRNHSYYVGRCVRKIRRAGHINVPNNRKGKQTPPILPIGNTKEQLEVLVLRAELYYSKLLNLQSAEQRPRESAIRHKAKQAAAAALRFANAAELFADKATKMESHGFKQFINGVAKNVHKDYAGAAQCLQTALHAYNQVRVLFATDTDGIAAVAEATSLIEKELRRAAFSAAASGIPVPTTVDAVPDNRQTQKFLWKGAELQIPTALLAATGLTETLALPLLPNLLERMDDPQFVWDRAEAERLIKACREQGSKIFGSLEGLRSFLLQEGEMIAQDALLATESHLRELAKCILVQGEVLIFAQYFLSRPFTNILSSGADTQIPHGLVAQVADSMAETLRDLAESKAVPGCSPALRAKITAFNAYVHEHLQPFIALAQACRQVAVCMHLLTEEPAKAYAVARVCVAQFESLQEEDWCFPDSDIWEGSPLHRVAHSAKLLVMAYVKGNVANIENKAITLLLRKQLGHVRIPCDERVLGELAKKAESVKPKLTLQPVPMKPIFYDIAGMYLNADENVIKRGRPKVESDIDEDDDALYHDFDEEVLSAEEGEEDMTEKKSAFLNFASWLRR